MEFIIEKAFMEKFSSKLRAEGCNSMEADIIKLFKKLKNFRLITDFQINNLSAKEIENNLLLEALMSNFSPKVVSKTDLLNEIKDTAFYSNTCPCKLFFITATEEECNKLRNDFGFEYLNTTNYNEKWKVYYSEREDNKRIVTKDKNIEEAYRFDCWDTLKQYKHPFNSLLIFDKYLLSDDNQDETIKNNLFKMLENLISIRKINKSKLNLMIIVDAKATKEIKKYHKIISDFLDNLIGKTNYKLNIVRLKKIAVNDEGSHYRCIYTNYFRIGADDSFTFFEKNGKVKNKASISFEFIYNNRTWQTVLSEIKDIKNYLKVIENIEKSDYVKNEEIYYFKDKNNNLLNITDV